MCFRSYQQESEPIIQFLDNNPEIKDECLNLFIQSKMLGILNLKQSISNKGNKMKIFNSQTQEHLELTEHQLKCYVFMEMLKDRASHLPGHIAYKCGVLSGECAKIISTVYTLEELCSESDKKYIATILEILSEILGVPMFKEVLKNLLEDLRDEFLNRDYIYTIEYNEL